MANRLSNRGMAKSDGHIARKERQMFGRRRGGFHQGRKDRIDACRRPRIQERSSKTLTGRGSHRYVRPLCAAPMAAGLDDIRGLNPIHVDELGALTEPRVFPIPGFDRFASRHNPLPKLINFSILWRALSSTPYAVAGTGT